MTDLFDRIRSICGEAHVQAGASLAPLTTFKIGGPADILVQAQNEDQIAAVFQACKDAEVPYFFLGKGSNLLVSDEGFRGVVLTPGEGLSQIRINGNELTAGCGVSLARLSHAALDAGLTGLEFASGIPGSFGGAVYMNAGAYGGEMSQVLKEITYLDETGTHTMAASEAEYGYRTSWFMTHEAVIVRAAVTLQQGETERISALMQDLNARRRDKQPLEYPSAGSMFKRPEGYFAGKLIQDAGLAGFSVGDAAVSTKHCGFVINLGHAAAADVLELVTQVQERVHKAFGVMIWPEVRFLSPTGLVPMLGPES